VPGRPITGVDLKQIEDGIFAIELNDNPNLDHGVEDAARKVTCGSG
jgi:glutathione synthase/RimK-type ligase-like ATP-grasp enzyme